MTDVDFSGEAFSTSHYLVRCVRVRVGVGLMLMLWLWSGLYVVRFRVVSCYGQVSPNCRVRCGVVVQP